jgi:hypothetical protein
LTTATTAAAAVADVVGTSAQATAPKSAALPQEFSDADSNNNNNKNTIDNDNNDDDSKKSSTLTISIHHHKNAMVYAQGARIIGLLAAVYCWISLRRKDDKDGTKHQHDKKSRLHTTHQEYQTSQRLSRLTRRRSSSSSSSSSSILILL